MDIIVRKAEICDIPNLIKLNDEFNGSGATFESMKESLDNSKNEVVFIAVADGEAVGFICGIYWQSICFAGGLPGIITELYVTEKYRRNGIASKLIQALEQEFARLNVCEITLATPYDNFIGQKFYESCGYSDRKEMVYDKLIVSE